MLQFMDYDMISQINQKIPIKNLIVFYINLLTYLCLSLIIIFNNSLLNSNKLQMMRMILIFLNYVF